MSYGSFAIEPVGGFRVNPVTPTVPPLRLGTRQDGGVRGGGQAGSDKLTQAAQERPVELPPLSGTSLRAQAVSGLLEARRNDLVGAEQAVRDPGAAARRSLADVWPQEQRERPDAKAAQHVSLTRADDEATDRKHAKARRDAEIRADLLTRTAQEEAARAAAEQADAEREADAEQARVAQLATGRAADDVQARRAAAVDQAGAIEGASPERPARRDAERAEADRRDVRPERDAPDRTGGVSAARAESLDAADAVAPRSLADVARAADDVRRLRSAVRDYADTVRAGIERAVGEVNDLAARVAATNEEIGRAVDGGGPVPMDLARRREQLVVSLARLTGATATPGSRSAVDVFVDGRPLVAGGQARPLEATTNVDGREVVRFADGQPLAPSSGVLASRLGTYNGVLTDLGSAASLVLTHLAEQATDPTGAAVPGGPAAAAAVGGLLREVTHAAQSSAAYANVAAGVEDLVSRLAQGDLPSSARGSNLLLGAVEDTPKSATTNVAETVGPLRAALSDLGAVAAEATRPGATLPATGLVSGAPGIASPLVAPDAPAGSAVVRVLSLATGGAVASAQSFAPDSPLGDGHERTLGIVTGVGTAAEHTTLIDVGRYPTPADLVSYINQSNAGVRATLNELTGGTVQLYVEALRTGRGQNITIVNGAQPPAASAILGRTVQLTGAHDAMVEVRQAGRTAAVRQSATNTISDVLPGVGLELHRADPGRAFEVGVRREHAAVLDLAGRLVDRAAAAVGAARAAGAPTTADRVLAALGLAAPTPGAVAAGAALVGGVPGQSAPTGQPEGSADAAQRAVRAGFPGVHLDRQGNPALDKGHLAAAFEADAETTAARLTAASRALSSVAANTDGATWEAYAAAAAAQGRDALATYTPDTRRAGRDDAVTADLTRRERALLSVLNRFQDQGEWLGRQLVR